MKPILNYFSASWAEIRKITWPTRRQLVRLTGIVIVFAVALSVVLAGVDYGFETLVRVVITKG